MLQPVTIILCTLACVQKGVYEIGICMTGNCMCLSNVLMDFEDFEYKYLFVVCYSKVPIVFGYSHVHGM